MEPHAQAESAQKLKTLPAFSFVRSSCSQKGPLYSSPSGFRWGGWRRAQPLPLHSGVGKHGRHWEGSPLPVGRGSQALRAASAGRGPDLPAHPLRAAPLLQIPLRPHQNGSRDHLPQRRNPAPQTQLRRLCRPFPRTTTILRSEGSSGAVHAGGGRNAARGEKLLGVLLPAEVLAPQAF